MLLITVRGCYVRYYGKGVCVFKIIFVCSIDLQMELVKQLPLQWNIYNFIHLF